MNNSFRSILARLHLLLSSLLLIAMNTHALGTIDSLEVKDRIISFSLSSPKTHTLPGCVAPETNQNWTMSLQTPEGVAAYTLLVTAVSSQMTVNAESAGDCALVPGQERAGRVWLQGAPE